MLSVVWCRAAGLRRGVPPIAGRGLPDRQFIVIPTFSSGRRGHVERHVRARSTASRAVGRRRQAVSGRSVRGGGGAAGACASAPERASRTSGCACPHPLKTTRLCRSERGWAIFASMPSSGTAALASPTAPSTRSSPSSWPSRSTFPSSSPCAGPTAPWRRAGRALPTISSGGASAFSTRRARWRGSATSISSRFCATSRPTARPIRSWNSRTAAAWPSSCASRAGACRPTRCAASPRACWTGWAPCTSRASSIATSSRPTSSSATTAFRSSSTSARPARPWAGARARSPASSPRNMRPSSSMRSTASRARGPTSIRPPPCCITPSPASRRRRRQAASGAIPTGR